MNKALALKWSTMFLKIKVSFIKKLWGQGKVSTLSTKLSPNWQSGSLDIQLGHSKPDTFIFTIIFESFFGGYFSFQGAFRQGLDRFIATKFFPV